MYSWCVHNAEVEQRGLTGIHCDAIQAGRLVWIPVMSKLSTLAYLMILTIFLGARMTSADFYSYIPS